MDDNLGGFDRVLMSVVGDNKMVKDILKLIPDNVVLPMFYKGERVTYKPDNLQVVVTNIGWKNGGYIYYFRHDGEEFYSYEEDLKLN